MLGINKRRCKRCAVVAGMLFTLALFPLAWAFHTFPGDRWALLGTEGLHAGWMSDTLLAVTKLGAFPVSAFLILTVVTVLILTRHRVDALIVALTAIPLGAAFMLKDLVDRARPDLFLIGSQPASMSFPSGHAAYAILLGGILLFLVGELVESKPVRRALQVGLALLVLAMGFSRVYLGVHWPSDVIGGYLFGGISLLGLIWLRGRLLAGPSTVPIRP